jgi:uncharacterized YigZ family protein
MSLFSDTYLTIDQNSEAIFKDKGSKFLAFAYPITNEQQVKEILQRLKKEHHTANHHCYAYRLGEDKLNVRANDDGEPSNTAGKPILGQIQSNDLTDICIVVVRYFGGTLLGVSGLINAYKQAAAEAIKAANVIEKHILFSYHIQFNFKQLNEVMKLLKQLDVKITHQAFDNACEINFKVRKANAELCEEKLKKIEGLILSYK